MCKMPKSTAEVSAASKQIKNAINPLMLDQKSPPWFQKHDARCRSGITVNLCYYKCAFFSLALFSHRWQKRELGALWVVCCRADWARGCHSSSQFAFQAILIRQGMIRRGHSWADLALGQDRSWCHCQGIWCPRFPRQVHKSSWDRGKAAPSSKGLKEWCLLTFEMISTSSKILCMDLITIFLLISWVDSTHNERNLNFHS